MLNCVLSNQGTEAIKQVKETGMNHSKKTISFMDRIIDQNAKYDNDIDAYHLDYQDIPDDDLEELTAYLMAEDESFACEFTGADNPRFTNHMLPALIDFMKNTGNKDNAYEFMNQWKKGISSYGENTVTRLLEWRLRVHNYYMDEEGE